MSLVYITPADRYVLVNNMCDSPGVLLNAFPHRNWRSAGLTTSSCDMTLVSSIIYTPILPRLNMHYLHPGVGLTYEPA